MEDFYKEMGQETWPNDAQWARTPGCQEAQAILGLHGCKFAWVKLQFWHCLNPIRRHHTPWMGPRTDGGKSVQGSCTLKICSWYGSYPSPRVPSSPRSGSWTPRFKTRCIYSTARFSRTEYIFCRNPTNRRASHKQPVYACFKRGISHVRMAQVTRGRDTHQHFFNE